MDLQTVLHMAKGSGETSFAMNSQLQRTVICKVKPLVQETIMDMYAKNQSQCLTIADLGCSSGPNSLLVIQEIVDAVVSQCRRSGHMPPEFEFILNDLVGNDFNTIIKCLPGLIQKLNKEMGNEFVPCFISVMPGTFYGRLFPSESLHFVHSSYALNFLSQFPTGIGNTEGDIYITRASPPLVHEGYLTQFQKDFTLFLGSRSQEIVPEGRMVLTLVGRRNPDPAGEECCQVWELLAQSLREMVVEGLIEKAKLESYNMPEYYPSREELVGIVEEERSFSISYFGTFDVDWDTSGDIQNKDHSVFDKKISGENVSRYLRAVVESTFVNHFGEEIMENLFQKYAEHLGEYMAKGKGHFVTHVMCLSKN